MRASKSELPIIFEAGPANIRATDWEGERIAIVSAPAGTDFAPLLQGLPSDRCPCPHWGYVMKGRLQIQHADGSEETLRSGDVFYLPPGHTGMVVEDVEFLEFSPPDEHDRFVDAAQHNLAALAG